MYYKYYIKKHGDQFYFGLYPGNNNRQPIAISNDYPTEDHAKEEIELLRKLLSTDGSAFITSEEERGYFFDLKENELRMGFRRTKAIQSKYQVPKCIKRIYDNLDAPLKQPLGKDMTDI